MRIIGRGKLADFKQRHSDARGQIDAWVADVESSIWTQPLDIAPAFANARTISADRAVFDIKGNRYRLVVRIDYRRGIVEVRFCGTHQEYDRIDALTI